MKVVRGKPSNWRYDGKNMVREAESLILLNYSGHGVNSRRDTANNLINQLLKFDPGSKVCISSDDEDREGVYIIETESRRETAAEKADRHLAALKAEEAAEALADVRARSNRLVKEIKKRSVHARRTKLEDERRALEAALLDILTKLDKVTYLETFRELREEQNMVQARLQQISIDLAAL